jgi:hypothetical protein
MAESESTFDRRLPATIHDVMGWGKHRTLTYAEAAQRDPGYVKWAAEKVGGDRGRLAAEAIALHLGVE